MEQHKVTVLVKDLSVRKKRELREWNLKIITSILLFLSMASLVIVLRLEDKFLVSEDIYFHELPASSVCSNRSINLKKLIAPKDVLHWKSDEELLCLASMVPGISESLYNHTPKVAFMFLSKGRLPLAPLWERFFKGQEGLYSIYLHTSPKFSKEHPKSSVFHKRRIPSKAVQWGKVTMIDAERRLLANALLDFSNERFVLLSDTCIPLFNFTTIYNYLIKSNLSFVRAFDDPRLVGRGRYSKRMFPTVSLADWRKGNQWFEIQRKIAIEVVSDVRFYHVFKDHCKGTCHLEVHCKSPCYMDEHYLPTLVTKLYPAVNSNRSITWVDWSREGRHPTKFVRKDVSEKFLNRIRYGFNCTYNGELINVCYLFARKFHPSTLEPLLRSAVTLFGFDP